MSRLRWAALAGCLLLCAGTADAQTPVQEVLLLQSFPRGSLALDSFTANFRADLDERARQPVNVVQANVETTGGAGPAERAIVDYIQATFAGRPRPALIVTIGGQAAGFARAHRPQLFPDTPVLFASLDQGFLRDRPPGENE